MVLNQIRKKASIRGLHVFARSVNLPSSTLSHLTGVRNYGGGGEQQTLRLINNRAEGQTFCIAEA